jgi:chemotaxis protein MotC
MRALRLVLLSLAIAVAVAPARGGEAAREPFEVVRSLQLSQDAIAHGDTSSHLSQRDQLAQIGERLAQADAKAWADPRNVRALITFALSGGNASLLQSLISRIPAGAIDEKLVQGALAYAQGRNAAAAELLAKVDARTLASGVAGHVALVQSELVAKTDPTKALALLDDARLLSPGTLIEEAALRRQAAIVAARGEFDSFLALSANYLRRFPNSVYAVIFRDQFATLVAEHDFAAHPHQLAKFEAALDALSPVDRRNINLAVAREGLIKGKLTIARFAADNAMRISEADSVEDGRAKIYQAAALIVSDEGEKASASLRAIERGKLSQEDVELAEAAGAVVAEIQRLPAEPAGAPPPGAADDTAARFSVVGRAREALARTDQLLAEARR